MATLIERLNALADDVSNTIERVNNGGCAVFASHVAYHLKYVRGVKEVVVRAGDYDSHGGRLSVDAARKKVKKSNALPCDWNSAGVFFSHVIVEFTYRKKKYHYDSHSGVVSETRETHYGEYPLYKGGMTVEEGLAIASTPIGWNPTFNRKNIPRMIKLINKHLG